MRSGAIVGVVALLIAGGAAAGYAVATPGDDLQRPEGTTRSEPDVARESLTLAWDATPKDERVGVCWAVWNLGPDLAAAGYNAGKAPEWMFDHSLLVEFLPVACADSGRL